MKLSNITFFRFPATLDFSELERKLGEHPLTPVGPLEMVRTGFVSPFGREGAVMCHEVGQAIWLATGSERRILPGSVVNNRLAEVIAEFEKKQGRAPGGKLRKQMKEDVLHELIPKAFVEIGRMDATIDRKFRFLAVNTASAKGAEDFASELRTALGSFPAIPLNAEVSLRGLMTGWLCGEPLPDDFVLGDEVELKDPADGGACWKGSRADLTGEEVTRHIESGKQVTRLALIYRDHVSFVLGEDLRLRKFKLLEAALEPILSMEHEDLVQELDVRYTLAAAELRLLFEALESALKLSAVD